MMSNVFEDTMGAIGDLLANEFSGVISNLNDVTDEDNNPIDAPSVIDETSLSTAPDYPYITLGLVDDFIQQSYANWSHFFSIEIQVKIVGDDKIKVLGLNRELYLLLWRSDTMSSLNSMGISIQSASELPNTVDNINEYNQYTSGWSIKLAVNEEHTAQRDPNKTPTDSSIVLRKDE